MILTLIAIGVLVLGIIITAIGVKFEAVSDNAVIGVIAIVLLIGGGLFSGLFLFTIVGNQLPTTQYNLQLEYEETYNTLTASLKADKNNVTVLADKIAEYNVRVKKHYACSESPWTSWLEPTINAELKTINLEDYLN